MKPGLELSVAYSDEHLLELRVVASNGQFSGRTEVYVALDTPRALANLLSGFPANSDDVRNFNLGSSTEATGQGSATLRFYCRDSAGHVAVQVQLRTASDHLDRVSTATFHIDLEPASVDMFVGQLRKMSSAVGAQASIAAAV